MLGFCILYSFSSNSYCFSLIFGTVLEAAGWAEAALTVTLWLDLHLGGGREEPALGAVLQASGTAGLAARLCTHSHVCPEQLGDPLHHLQRLSVGRGSS